MSDKDLRSLFLGLNFIGSDKSGPVRDADVTIGILTKDKRRNISIAIRFKDALAPQVKVAIGENPDRLYLLPVDKGGFKISENMPGANRIRVSVPQYRLDIGPFEGVYKKLHHIEKADIYYINKEERYE